MNTDQLGQWGEHVAAAWFIRRGYNVYFPKSRINASIDFIVEKDGKSHSIQVKASSYMQQDKKCKSKFPAVRTTHKGGFDYLFAVHTCGKARIYPIDKAPTGKARFGNSDIMNHPYDVNFY